MIEPRFKHLRNMLAEVEVTIKTTSCLRTVYDGIVLLPSF